MKREFAQAVLILVVIFGAYADATRRDAQILAVNQL